MTVYILVSEGDRNLGRQGWRRGTQDGLGRSFRRLYFGSKFKPRHKQLKRVINIPNVYDT